MDVPRRSMGEHLDSLAAGSFIQSQGPPARCVSSGLNSINYTARRLNLGVESRRRFFGARFFEFGIGGERHVRGWTSEVSDVWRVCM
jgi:hypothetical protein